MGNEPGPPSLTSKVTALIETLHITIYCLHYREISLGTQVGSLAKSVTLPEMIAT